MAKREPEGSEEIDAVAGDLLPRIAAKRDPRDLGLLLRRHADFLYSIALRITGHPADAEDATQEAWMEIIRTAGEFRPERGTERAWLARIAVWRARDQARKRSRAAAITARAMEEAPMEPSVDRDPVLHPSMVEALVRDLPDPFRDPVLLRYYQGLSHREVAQALDRPEGTVRRQVAEGIDWLRQRVSQAGVAVSVGILVGTMRASPLYAMPASLGASLSGRAVGPAGAGGGLAGSALPWIGGVLVKKTAVAMGCLCLAMLVGFGAHRLARSENHVVGPGVPGADRSADLARATGGTDGSATDSLFAQADPIASPDPAPPEVPRAGGTPRPPVENAPHGCRRDRSRDAATQSMREIRELYTGCVLFLDDYGAPPSDLHDLVGTFIASREQVFCAGCGEPKYILVPLRPDEASPTSALFAYDRLCYEGDLRVVAFMDGHTEIGSESSLQTLLANCPVPPRTPAEERAAHEQEFASLADQLASAVHLGDAGMARSTLNRLQARDMLDLADLRIDPSLLWEAVRIAGSENLAFYVPQMLSQRSRMSDGEIYLLFNLIRGEDLNDRNASDFLLGLSRPDWIGATGMLERLQTLSSEGIRAERKDALQYALLMHGDETTRRDILARYVSGDMEDRGVELLTGAIPRYTREQVEEFESRLRTLGSDSSLPLGRRSPAILALFHLDPTSAATTALQDYPFPSEEENLRIVRLLLQTRKYLPSAEPAIRPHLERIAQEDSCERIRQMAADALTH